MKSPHGTDGNEQSLLDALMATEALASPNGDEGHDDTLVYEEVDEEANVDEELQGMAVAALRQKIHSAQNSPTRETPIGRHIYWCSKVTFIHFVRRCLAVAIGIYCCSITLLILIRAEDASGAAFIFSHPHDVMTGQISNPEVLQKIHRFYSL